jgi:cytochrome c-type biogenesis protein CcmH/NrfG
VVVRAHALLGAAYDAKGDAATARTEWERVVAAWPKDTPSKTLRRAEERLARGR